MQINSYKMSVTQVIACIGKFHPFPPLWALYLLHSENEVVCINSTITGRDTLHGHYKFDLKYFIPIRANDYEIFHF